MIVEEDDDCFSIDENIYTITNPKDSMVLKKIIIKKKPIEYFFIGGMCYSKNNFSFENNISLPYPFTTYYTLKILDENINGILCRSLIYVKLPLIIYDMSINMSFLRYVNFTQNVYI